jgi:hypothetical protein
MPSSQVEGPDRVQTGRGRILIDASMARGGGGFTYLVNLVPHLSAAAEMRFLVLVRDASRAFPRASISCCEKHQPWLRGGAQTSTSRWPSTRRESSSVR